MTCTRTSTVDCPRFRNVTCWQVAAYGKLAAQLSDLGHLNSMHYDPRAGQYRDWGNHTEDVRLDWRYADIPMQLPGGQVGLSPKQIRGGADKGGAHISVGLPCGRESSFSLDRIYHNPCWTEVDTPLQPDKQYGWNTSVL